MTNITKFFTQFPVRQYKRGQLVLTPSDNLSAIYYISSGQVRMYHISSTAQEITLHNFKEKSYFPIMFILANVPNKYFFESLTLTKIHVAPAAKVLAHLSQNPSDQQELLKNLSKGLVGLLTRIEHLTSESTTSQLKSLLNYLKSQPRQTKLTHQHLANWLGISRETVSRLYNSVK